MNNTSSQHIKKIYENKLESIDGRLSQHFPLRRYVHETGYRSIARFIKSGETVLDNGCGEGVLAVLLTKQGARVTACDISKKNIIKAKRYADEQEVNNINFLNADAETLPFPDNHFDWVISNHVLEHLPNFEQGLKEVQRVTKKRAIIALPTCLNLCAAVLLGGDNFWSISRRTPFAWLIGINRILFNIFKDGVNENYSGNPDLPHLWRYPWVMRRDLRKAGFNIKYFEAASLCLPYFSFLIPLVKKMDYYKGFPLLRNLGYGSIAIVEK